MSSYIRQNEEGFALAATVLALIVVGALVTGSFFAANQESRIGHSSKFATDAFLAAERGINEVLGTFTLPDYDDIAVDEDTVLVDTVTSGGVRAETIVRVRNIDNDLFFVEATGRVLDGGNLGGATRRTGMVIRRATLDFGVKSALKTFGGLNVSGNAAVDGRDKSPAGWSDCPTSPGDKAGILAKDTSTVEVAKPQNVNGIPAVDEDSTLSGTDFLDYGALDYEKLAALATVQIPAGTTVKDLGPTYIASADSTVCNTSDPRNWGAPDNANDPCHLHFPVIHAQGDLHMNANDSGQGILLVDGDLHINGNFSFSGVVIVRGVLDNGSGGSHVQGTVLVYTDGVLGDPYQYNGNPLIQYSSCGVDRAVKYNTAVSRGFPLGDRSWVDLSATGGVTY